MDNFWSTTCFTELLKSSLCNKLRKNLCGSLVLLFSVFINISFPCLYLDNNRLTSLFIVCFAKSSLCFIIKSVSYLKLLSKSLNKLKWIVFGFVLITSLLSLMIHCYRDLIKLLYSALLRVCCLTELWPSDFYGIFFPFQFYLIFYLHYQFHTFFFQVAFQANENPSA